MYLAIIFYIFIILEYYGNIMKALWIMHRLMYHIQGYVQIFLYLHSSEVGHPKLTRVAHKRWIASGIHLLGWWYTWVDPHPAIDQQQSLLNYKTLWGWRNHKNIGRWKHLESPSVEEFLALLDFWYFWQPDRCREEAHRNRKEGKLSKGPKGEEKVDSNEMSILYL